MPVSVERDLSKLVGRDDLLKFSDFYSLLMNGPAIVPELTNVLSRVVGWAIYVQYVQCTYIYYKDMCIPSTVV